MELDNGSTRVWHGAQLCLASSGSQNHWGSVALFEFYETNIL
jgi:hypothetical protein